MAHFPLLRCPRYCWIALVSCQSLVSLYPVACRSLSGCWPSVRRAECSSATAPSIPHRSASFPNHRVQADFEAVSPLSTARIPPPLQSPASPSGEARPVLRANTFATRVRPEELAEVETAAEGAGKTLREWLRELALKAARECPADPTELILAEVSALRYMLLNLFHVTGTGQA